MRTTGAVSHLLLLALSAFPGVSQEVPTRPGPARLTYQVFLLGNTGASTPEDVTPTLQLLTSQLAAAGENSAVVFTGDLLPCCGLPAEGDSGRAGAEQRLMALVEAVRTFEGRVIVVPGDQDWGDNAATGWRSVATLEEFLETAFDRGNVFVPDDGFPGPQPIRLTDYLRLIALNTEWLLTDGSRPTGDTGDYDVALAVLVGVMISAPSGAHGQNDEGSTSGAIGGAALGATSGSALALMGGLVGCNRTLRPSRCSRITTAAGAAIGLTAGTAIGWRNDSGLVSCPRDSCT